MLGGSVRVKEKHLLTLLEPTTVITTHRERKGEQERAGWGKALRCRQNQRQLRIRLLFFSGNVECVCAAWNMSEEAETNDGVKMIV